MSPGEKQGDVWKGDVWCHGRPNFITTKLSCVAFQATLLRPTYVWHAKQPKALILDRRARTSVTRQGLPFRTTGANLCLCKAGLHECVVCLKCVLWALTHMETHVWFGSKGPWGNHTLVTLVHVADVTKLHTQNAALMPCLCVCVYSYHTRKLVCTMCAYLEGGVCGDKGIQARLLNQTLNEGERD